MFKMFLLKIWKFPCLPGSPGNWGILLASQRNSLELRPENDLWLRTLERGRTSSFMGSQSFLFLSQLPPRFLSPKTWLEPSLRITKAVRAEVFVDAGQGLRVNWDRWPEPFVFRYVFLCRSKSFSLVGFIRSLSRLDMFVFFCFSQGT